MVLICVGNFFKLKISQNHDSSVLYYNSALKGKKGISHSPLAFVLRKSKEVASPCSFCLLRNITSRRSGANIASTLYQYCTFCGCQHLHANTVGGDLWKGCSAAWLTGFPGQAEDHCPQGGLLGSLDYCYCVPNRCEFSDQLWGGNGNHSSLLHCIHHVMLVSMLFYSHIAPQ